MNIQISSYSRNEMRSLDVGRNPLLHPDEDVTELTLSELAFDKDGAFLIGSWK
ncbi:hypothetical protein [Paenibacillus mesophilus]|uniref:hypothetical protein n=1 Tax=Paenibacillus mesophilus TaxID=2582849 RepID=UPI0013052F91|nr:hypothetical protein [Paenibacillus mesophilus]